MHILMVAAIGLLLLGAFVLGGYQLNKTTGLATGAYYFIWFWLAAAIVNGIFGTMRAGIPVINEIGAFIPIFGIPAAIAFYLLRR
ncbi:MAG TPA: hypothetical protein VJL90_08870 [Pseudorhodoplanes sp.]|nr:hypothetical protein [Pseudorhodoplanes sp.]